MNDLLSKPKISKYTLDPYSARVLILNLEKEHDLTIQVYIGDKYCLICVDMEDKEDE